MKLKRILLILFSLFLLSTMTAFAQVTVNKVTLSTHKVVLTEGQTVDLSVRYSYVGASEDVDIEWDSNNDKVAEVSNGHIKALHSGKTQVIININNTEDYCDIIVNTDHPHFTNTKQCYTELNKHRKHGKLKKDKTLEKIAKLRAKEMAESGKFSHTRPNGKSSLTLVKRRCKGENIACGQKTAKEVTNAWYHSKGHRANMLRKQFHKVGIAGYKYKGTIYWVQIYSS